MRIVVQNGWNRSSDCVNSSDFSRWRQLAGLLKSRRRIIIWIFPVSMRTLQSSFYLDLKTSKLVVYHYIQQILHLSAIWKSTIFYSRLIVSTLLITLHTGIAVRFISWTFDKARTNRIRDLISSRFHLTTEKFEIQLKLRKAPQIHC